MANTTITSIFVEPLSTVSYTTPVKLSTVKPGDRVLTLEEVSWHDNPADCWIVIYDRVYDITDFLNEHPGGSDILLEYGGRDATVAFRGSGHSIQAMKALEVFMIGDLPEAESIFRKQGGYLLSDIPD